MTQANRFFHTDLDIKAAKNFLTVFDQAPSFPISTITLSTENVFAEDKSIDGQYILVPQENPDDFTSIHRYISDKLASGSAVIAIPSQL